MYIADLHIHSRYSRATSRDCTPEYLDLWARRKGIGLIGTGDFTHPAWREELEEKLEPTGEGFYRLKEEYRIRDGSVAGGQEPRFVVTGEISSIYKKKEKTRKVHSLILLPGLVAVCFALAVHSGFHRDLEYILMVVLVATAAPPAVMLTQTSQTYGGDPRYASIINVMGTILCIVTIPLIIAFYEYLVAVL